MFLVNMMHTRKPKSARNPSMIYIQRVGLFQEIGAYVTVKTGLFEKTARCRPNKFAIRNDINSAFYDELNLVQCGYNFNDWMYLSVKSSQIAEDLYMTFDIKRIFEEGEYGEWTKLSDFFGEIDMGVLDDHGLPVSNFTIDDTAGTITFRFSPFVQPA